MLVTTIFSFSPNVFYCVRDKFCHFRNFRILDQSKLKALADHKFKMIQMAKFLLDKIENIEEKEENTGYQHFLPSPLCFPEFFSLRSLNLFPNDKF